MYACKNKKKIGVDQVFQGMILNRIIENKTQSQIKDNEGLKKNRVSYTANEEKGRLMGNEDTSNTK